MGRDAPVRRGGYGNPASATGSGRRARRGLEDAREQHRRPARRPRRRGDFHQRRHRGQQPRPLRPVPATRRPTSSPAPSNIPPSSNRFVNSPAAGFTLDELPVDAQGVVDADGLGGGEPRCSPDRRDARESRNRGGAAGASLAERLAGRVAFHCDATQAVGKLPVHFADLGVTSLSLSATKFHGPKGAGALLLRRGAKLRPRTWGGHQQQGRRPGTESAALAVGLAAALDIACRDMERRTQGSPLAPRADSVRIARNGQPRSSSTAPRKAVCRTRSTSRFRA